MPQVSGSFSALPVSVTLDGSGNGTVLFQATGDNVRITNLFGRVSTSILQAVSTIYQGYIGVNYQLDNSNSGSTGFKASGNIDLHDGEVVYVQWVGGDPGATATATFTGYTLPLGDLTATAFAVDDNFAAGDGTIIYPALKSPNYVPGVAGWYLGRDGTLDVGSGTFRGSVVVSSPDGSQVAILAGMGGEIDFYHQTVVGVTQVSPGFIKSNYTGTAAAGYSYIVINSPLDNTGGGNINRGQLFIGGARSDGVPFPDFFTPRPLLEFSGDGEFHGGMVIDDFLCVGPNVSDMGQGVQGAVSSVASSTASGVEVAVLSATGFVWKAGRVYSVEMSGGVSSSVAGTVADFRLKKTVAGVISTSYGEYYRTPITVASQVFPGNGKLYLQNATGADITTDFALTLQSATNTVFASAAVGRPRQIIIRDEGLAADTWWANVTQVS